MHGPRLKDRDGVIDASWPAALLLPIFDTILSYPFVFRF
jgi:hypothetical protein